MELTYLGANTLVIEKSNQTLVIDPHFSRPGLSQLFRLRSDPSRVEQGLQLLGTRRVEAVLLTHTHYDHALDLLEVLRQAGGLAYGSASARQILLGAGFSLDCFHSVAPGEVYQIGSFEVRFHPARHIRFPAPLNWFLPESGRITTPLQGPSPFWDYCCGQVYAIQVDRTLVFGSAGYEPGAYAGLDLETVILGIGGLEAKQDAYLKQLFRETVLSTGVRKVWLSHWDNFFRPLDGGVKHLAFSNRTVNRFKILGKRHGRAVEELPFNQSVSVS